MMAVGRGRGHVEVSAGFGFDHASAIIGRIPQAVKAAVRAIQGNRT